MMMIIILPAAASLPLLLLLLLLLLLPYAHTHTPTNNPELETPGAPSSSLFWIEEKEDSWLHSLSVCLNLYAREWERKVKSQLDTWARPPCLSFEYLNASISLPCLALPCLSFIELRWGGRVPGEESRPIPSSFVCAYCRPGSIAESPFFFSNHALLFLSPLFFVSFLLFSRRPFIFDFDAALPLLSPSLFRPTKEVADECIRENETNETNGWWYEEPMPLRSLLHYTFESMRRKRRRRRSRATDSCVCLSTSAYYYSRLFLTPPYEFSISSFFFADLRETRRARLSLRW